MAEAAASPPPLRVVEFYAGAGGFHYALRQQTTASFLIVASIDINTNTNLVYQHNFPDTPHLNRNICGLTAKELDDLRGDMFVLSPPCQPFTRQGQRRDNLDTRTDSFFHLMQLLTEMKRLPAYLLMENVQGFEGSQTREHFTTILSSLHFVFQEFLLSPVQFGVPNSRLRYYLLAKRHPLQFTLPHLHKDSSTPCKDARPLLKFTSTLKPDKHVHHSISHSTVFSPPTKPPRSDNSSSLEPVISLLESDSSTLEPDSSLEPDLESDSYSLEPISSYLETLTEDQIREYLVPDKLLLKYAMAMDIVRSDCSRSCCFTRAYGHYAVGTGSVLQQSLGREELDVAFEGYKKALEEKCGAESDPLSFLRPLNLRYFTPREVANLMCFPPSFVFPTSLTHVQCYKVLGNSLNVHVVSILLQYLFT